MKAKVSYSLFDNSHCIKFCGDVRYSDVTQLHTYITQLHPQNLSFVIDVTQASHLDSTALGSLAYIAKTATSLGLSQPVIYVTCPQVHEALLGVCFDRVFEIKQEAIDTSNCDFEAIGADDSEIEQLTEAVHSAHQALADLSESNRKIFKDVNDLLKRKSQ